MRLLNTTTLTFVNFFGDDIPPYTILSHRWEDSEVTLQDMKNRRGPEMAGWVKIQGCCAQAASDGFAYTWIDSCCIDKSSSAELSETINSMFRWYQNAHARYVYLSDVTLEPRETHSQEYSSFSQSKWFSRGWTLQELIAPNDIIFFDRKWTEIGTKLPLLETIERITGITHLVQIDNACVAQKMSWAARRETTRPEDQAYCLMGLFSVNMPVIYGEGAKNAFYRLQIEILSRSEDESIFAWRDERYGFGGHLAESVSAFKHSGDVAVISKSSWKSRAPISMTNKGLQIEIEVETSEWEKNPRFLELLTPLNCIKGEKKERLALHLSSYGRHYIPQYKRSSCKEFKYIGNPFPMTSRITILVPQSGNFREA
ncbi:heterokaryon incompatibility protein-domain-containing protein [Tricladium varicosporioides]|nr:heterokaryon incompatibility protein-domain-containing protein [Hymenoscyphus varicosporioides]